MTLDGDTDSATLASALARADCTAGGTGVPAGKVRPSADVTRIVSKPDAVCGLPFGLSGVGVVDRVVLSSGAREELVEGFGDFLPNFQDMTVKVDYLSYREAGPAVCRLAGKRKGVKDDCKECGGINMRWV